MNDQANGAADAAGDLHEQAKAAIEHRVLEQFREHVLAKMSTRGEQLKACGDDVEKQEAVVEKHRDEDDSMLERLFNFARDVYEKAIERRGQHQAAIDALQSAVGLPLNPETRQAEVERREAHHEEAQRAAAGVGTGLTHEQLTEQCRINEGLAQENVKESAERIGDDAWAQDPRTDRGGEAKTEPAGETGREARDRADKAMREASERRQHRTKPPVNEFSRPQSGAINPDGTDSRWGGA